MTDLHLEKYVQALTWTIEDKKEAAKSAAKNEWFHKAAKLHDEIAGLTQAKYMAMSGDYHTGDNDK